MIALLTSVPGSVLAALGVAVLAVLDSTIFFSLPGGLDAAIVLLAARGGMLAWTVPALAIAGSMAGAALTFWMGAKIGEHGLDRYIPEKRLARVRQKVRRPGSVGLAVLDLIPPPFPFTPFILAAGALEVSAARFFVTLTACRVLRFGGEAVLAVVYGRHILRWLHSSAFHGIAIIYGILALVLTAVSIVKFLKPPHRTRHKAAA